MRLRESPPPRTPTLPGVLAPGTISKEAIAEAVRLAREALINHADELVTDTAR